MLSKDLGTHSGRALMQEGTRLVLAKGEAQCDKPCIRRGLRTGDLI